MITRSYRDLGCYETRWIVEHAQREADETGEEIELELHFKGHRPEVESLKRWLAERGVA